MTDAFSRIMSARSQPAAQPVDNPSGDAFSRIMGAAVAAAPPADSYAEPDAEGFVGGLKQMVRGKQDPRERDLGTVFEQFPRELQRPTANAAIFGASDEAMGDIVAKNLGDRFIRRERDANGYDIFVTRGPDGREQRGYLNKPGLDLQDVSRGIYGALPYGLVGGAAGGVLRGTAAAVRIGGQATAAGLTSLGGDLATIPMGSEQSPDLFKAAGTAAAGGLGELAAPAFGALYRRFVAEPRLFNRSTGLLTAEGEAAARSAGYDPAQMTAEIQREFAKTYAKTGGDAAQAVAATANREFAIPSTIGQRTKDAEQLLQEKGMRYGLQGDTAKGIVQDFGKRQAEAVKAAALDGADTVTGISGMIAPKRTGAELSPSNLGPSIRTGLQSAQGSAKAGERAAWDQVSDLTPKSEAFDTLPDMLAGRLGDLPIDDVNTKAAASMARAIDDYVEGKAVGAPVAKVLKQTPVTTLDQMRRRLLEMSRSADNETDRRAAMAIYDGFSDWIDDAAKRALVNGDPAAAAALRGARDTTKTMRQIFQATDRRGRATPGARIIDDVLQRSDSAEGIVSGMFGGGPAANIPDGTVEALKSMRSGLTKYARSDVGKDTWNDIRAAYWVRLVREKTGDMFSPGQMLKNIKLVQNNQGSVLRELFTPEEQATIGRFRQALEQITYKDPNPSGSGVAIATLAKQFIGKLLMSIPHAATAWEYSGIPGAMGKAAAKRAVAATPAPRNALSGPYGASLGNALQFEGEAPDRQNVLARVR